MFENCILNEIEYNALEKIARATKMDCWFLIEQDEDEDCDYVRDLENDVRMTLRDGISELIDGMADPPEDPSYGLDEEEIEAFYLLLDKLQIEAYWD